MCSGRWSPEKYVLDDSLNVTKIRGRKGVGEFKYEMKKVCPPLHMSWPPLATPLIKRWRRHWVDPGLWVDDRWRVSTPAKAGHRPTIIASQC